MGLMSDGHSFGLLGIPRLVSHLEVDSHSALDVLSETSES